MMTFNETKRENETKSFKIYIYMKTFFDAQWLPQ